MTDFIPGPPFDLPNPADQLPDALDVVDPGGEIRGPDLPSPFEAGADELGGLDPPFQPEAAWPRPGEADGQWVDGQPGDGRFAPTNPGAFGLLPGQSIQFLGEVADLADYTVQAPSGGPGIFPVHGLTGDADHDYPIALGVIADHEGMTPGEVEDWLHDEHLVLHTGSGGEVQVVTEQMHGALRDLASRAGDRTP
jgi:hypothetical protein